MVTRMTFYFNVAEVQVLIRVADVMKGDARKIALNRTGHMCNNNSGTAYIV